MLAPPANCEGNVVLRSPRRRTWGRGVEVVGRDTPSTSSSSPASLLRHPRLPSSVIPDPDRGPTPASFWPLIRNPLSHRHPGPRAGTHGQGAATIIPQTVTLHRRPSKELSSRIPRYGVIQGTRAATTTLIPHQHPLTPIPSFRHSSRNPGEGAETIMVIQSWPPTHSTVIPPPPEPRWAWLPPQPSTSTVNAIPRRTPSCRDSSAATTRDEPDPHKHVTSAAHTHFPSPGASV